ncbi:MAG: hypothetical protein ACLFRV_04075 [Acidimicrobiales bacterium]
MSDQPEDDRSDDRVKLPLDPEEALRALLAVDPDEEPGEDSPENEDQPGQRPG